jgi:hypothetical protein
MLPARLIVFRQASLRQRLRGVPFDLTGALLDVSRAHVWVQLSRQNVFSGFPGIGLMLGFDDSVGHDPIKLTFSAFNQPDGEALMFVVHDPESQRTRPLQTPPAGRNHSGAVHPSGPATGQPGDRPPDHAPSS